MRHAGLSFRSSATGVTVPAWVHAGSALDIDILGNRTWSGGAEGVVTDVLSCGRSTTGTYRTVAGVMTSYGVGDLRIGDAGLLVEAAATNNTTSSDRRTTSIPFGVLSLALAATSTAAPAVMSVFATSTGVGGWVDVSIWTGGFTAAATVTFDITSGSVGAISGSGVTGARIEAWDSGAWRCSVEWGGASVSGYGLDGGSADTVSVWGTQLEPGDAVTSYYATGATPATRDADSVSLSVPAGVASLTYTFDDGTTQEVAVVPGLYVIPADLNRPLITRIWSN